MCALRAGLPTPPTCRPQVSSSNGSFSYASVSFQGSGDTATNYGLTGTYTSSGLADMNYASSGVAASGANVLKKGVWNSPNPTKR